MRGRRQERRNSGKGRSAPVILAGSRARGARRPGCGGLLRANLFGQKAILDKVADGFGVGGNWFRLALSPFVDGGTKVRRKAERHRRDKRATGRATRWAFLFHQNVDSRHGLCVTNKRGEG